MKIYDSFVELLRDVDNLHWDASLYYDPDEWAANPLSARILFLTGDEEQEMDLVDVGGDELPAAAAEHNMKGFFDVQTFQDIVSVQKRNNPDSGPQDYVAAVNHYAEYDAFLT